MAEAGHNYLCDGPYFFFYYVRPTMTIMAQLVQTRPTRRTSDGVG